MLNGKNQREAKTSSRPEAVEFSQVRIRPRPAKRLCDAENGVTSFGDYRKQVGMVWFDQFLLKGPG